LNLKRCLSQNQQRNQQRELWYYAREILILNSEWKWLSKNSEKLSKKVKQLHKIKLVQSTSTSTNV